MDNIVWLTMRRMRTPLILMILVYSLSVFGMVLIPGQDETGRLVQVSFLDAAYFIAIMATTIGFGEMPVSFTEAQRLYAFIILFPNVVAWLYSIGTILSLFLDPQFRDVLQRSRFKRQIRWLGGPYYIVCGFGNTGNMIVKGLLKRGINAVILEREKDIIHGMALHDRFSHLPALSGDVTDRRLLELAGLHAPNCLGVMAITNKDHVNLTVAITCKLLRPKLPVFARSETRRVSANMASFGTDYRIDPYSIFAERFYLALSSPAKYLVQDWLISVPGTDLQVEIEPPAGHWIIAGLGRFGSRIAPQLEKAGLPFSVIDVHPDRIKNREGAVLGRGTEAHTLIKAGVKEAVGIIACTGDDVDNLSIIMTARELNPDLFIVVRQENQQNDTLFDSFEPELIARRSRIVARRMLTVATTPLLSVFLTHLVHENEAFTARVKKCLEAVLHNKAPDLWTEELTAGHAEAIFIAAKEGVEIRLEHITYNLRMEEPESLDCVCLLLERGALRLFLPGQKQELLPGDRLLFAGRGTARRETIWNLTEPSVLIGFATGRPQARGTLMRWLARNGVE
jgi:Trk K+ transport system NAD-binding subunit